MNNWDEIKTAYYVARCGTVSAAANELGVHHATVIRHIDALEASLGIKLFQRHPRGYTPTDAGIDLLQVAKITDEQFKQLSNRIIGQDGVLSGDLIITSLGYLVPSIIGPVARFRELHPNVKILIHTSTRLLKLEYGEAHVAIRAGSAPQEPDNVVQFLKLQKIGLYGSKDYLNRHGMPRSYDDLLRFDLIGSATETLPAPFYQWMREQSLEDAIKLRCDDSRNIVKAVEAGIGLGFVEHYAAQQLDLVEAIDALPQWDVNIWAVTHVDLHKSAKVSAFLELIKADFRR